MVSSFLPQSGVCSLLCTAHGHTRLAKGSATALLWEVGFVAHPCSQHLFLALPSLTEFCSLPHPCSLWLIQHFIPLLLTVVNYIHYLHHSPLFRWDSICSQTALDYSPEGRWCVVLTCWVYRFTQANLDTSQQGEMVGEFSQGR